MTKTPEQLRDSRVFMTKDAWLDVLRTLKPPTTVIKYDEDQPRDESGRWTDGDSTPSTPSQPATPKIDRQFRSKNGKIWYKATKERKLRVMARNLKRTSAKLGYREGTIDEIVQRWESNPDTMDALEQVDMWYSGDVSITTTQWGQEITDDMIVSVAETAEQLQESNPVGVTEIQVGTPDFLNFKEDSLIAVAYRGGGLMRVSTRAWEDKTDTPGHFMPSREETSRLEYTMTHEWGHMRDELPNPRVGSGQAAYDKLIQDKNDDIRRTWESSLLSGASGDDISKYGRSSYSELYAELFTEFVLTNGETKNIAVQKFAAKYGWGK